MRAVPQSASYIAQAPCATCWATRRVVHHYRAARDIALRDQRGEADTEALRQAVVHYRALFSELLEVDDPHGAPPRDVRATPLRDPQPAVSPPNRMEHH